MLYLSRGFVRHLGMWCQHDPDRQSVIAQEPWTSLFALLAKVKFNSIPSRGGIYVSPYQTVSCLQHWIHTSYRCCMGLQMCKKIYLYSTQTGWRFRENGWGQPCPSNTRATTSPEKNKLYLIFVYEYMCTCRRKYNNKQCYFCFSLFSYIITCQIDILIEQE